MNFLNIIKKIKKTNVGGAGHNFVGNIDKFDDLILVGWLKKEGEEAPQVTLVKNTNSGWARAIAKLLGNGATNRNDGAELRNWVLQNGMLGSSLGEYNKMLKALFKN